MHKEDLKGKVILSHSVQVFEGLTIVEIDFVDGERHLIVTDHKTGRSTERTYTWQETAGAASK